jgi:hypothetical protein
VVLLDDRAVPFAIAASVGLRFLSAKVSLADLRQDAKIWGGKIATTSAGLLKSCLQFTKHCIQATGIDDSDYNPDTLQHEAFD